MSAKKETCEKQNTHPLARLYVEVAGEDVAACHRLLRELLQTIEAEPHSQFHSVSRVGGAAYCRLMVGRLKEDRPEKEMDQ